jgi:demethylmenaquinone methyltransferase/2-methoxy-6-polyprenyl-1,4-benzoquinol methylase
MEYYNSIASGYNELYRDEQLTKLKLIRDYLRENNKLPGDSDIILDVGCGTGVTGEVFNNRIIGIDPSIELIKQANETDAMQGYCIQAMAEYLPFQDVYFNLTIALTSVQNFENIKRGLDEIGRVSRGIIVISVPLKSPKLDEIQKLIDLKLNIIEKIEEDKDLIFFLIN